MSWLLLVTALGLAVPEREDPPPAGPDATARALQGDWQPVKMLEGGKQVPKALAGVVFTFRDGQLTITENGQTRDTATYTLDTKQALVAIDLVGREGKAHMKGVLRLQGDVLTIAVPTGPGGGDRPREIASPPGSQVGLIELRRARR